MLWKGWGDPELAEPLPGEVRRLLRDALGVRPPARSGPAGPADVRLPDRALPRAFLAELSCAVGEDNLRTDADSRVRHTRGKSTTDLLRIRAGEATDAPDAVVLPGGPEEVRAVLRACTEHRIPVVPFGGGTSVVGGLAPGGPFVALDLRRLDRLLAVDPVSRTATLEPGVRGPRAEELLRGHGFTLGHVPQSYEWASLGGFAATRSSGQASAGYGRFDDLVLGLTVVTPRGTLELGRAPRSAAGPDLRQLVLGSEGAFGVITSLTVRVRPVPEEARYEGWRFGSFHGGTAAVRRLAQDGALPTVVRLSDEAETAVGTSPGGCLLITGYEGARAEVSARRTAAAALLRAAGGVCLGEEPGAGWARGRFSAPYLRDALLDAGAFAETLETATFWSGLPRLYREVRDALGRALPRCLVLCHISHVYPAGASLYFTVVAAGGEGVLGEWAAAKRAAGDAIMAAGGTISHHHGVGTDHREWYAQEIGPLGVEVLRAIKDRLDPAGIMNPGILIP